MELLTEELQEQAENQYPKGSDMDQMIVAKFFTPWTNWTWYLMNKEPESDYCWGIVEGHDIEAGSFSLAELRGIAGPFEMEIERDLHFVPLKANELWKELHEEQRANS